MSDDIAVPVSDTEASVPAVGAPPIFRGVRRALATRGYASLTEFRWRAAGGPTCSPSTRPATS